MLGSAESEKVRLISGETIFEDFVLMITTPQRYRRTDRQADRRTDNLPWQYRAPPNNECMYFIAASRGLRCYCTPLV